MLISKLFSLSSKFDLIIGFSLLKELNGNLIKSTKYSPSNGHCLPIN
jgi:hypothetical protein